ncbi:MAG: hypothetical protein H0Z32_10840 [Bacillaceae bacterium]|nr:hypothetical protein [Bacillaceae bacterium]
MVLIAYILFMAFIVLDFYLFRYFFRQFFDDADHFWECIKLDLRPDIISLFKGELLRDWEAEFRVGIFFFLCFIVLVIEFFILRGVF